MYITCRKAEGQPISAQELVYVLCYRLTPGGAYKIMWNLTLNLSQLHANEKPCTISLTLDT